MQFRSCSCSVCYGTRLKDKVTVSWHNVTCSHVSMMDCACVFVQVRVAGHASSLSMSSTSVRCELHIIVSRFNRAK